MSFWTRTAEPTAPAFATGVELYAVPDDLQIESIQVIRNADGSETVQVSAAPRAIPEPVVLAYLAVPHDQ